MYGLKERESWLQHPVKNTGQPQDEVKQNKHFKAPASTTHMHDSVEIKSVSKFTGNLAGHTTNQLHVLSRVRALTSELTFDSCRQ